MKFSTNIKTYALGISLILMPSTAKPMHATATQRILSKVCTALSWGIAAGPSIFGGAMTVHELRNHKKKIDQLENASPEVTQFVHEALKERGIPNYQTIAIKKNPIAFLPNEYESYSRAILIPHPEIMTSMGILNEKYMKDPTKDARFFFPKPKGALLFFPYLNLRQLSELTTYFQNPDDNLRQKAWLEKKRLSPYTNKKHVKAALNLCNESLNIHRAIIHHEAAHVVNKDGVRQTIACLVFPVITHAGLTLCTYPLKQLLNNRYKVNILTKGVLKIFAATFIKCPINLAMLLAHKRYQEQKADDYVADDLALLRSIRDHWKWEHKYSTAISSFVEHGNTLSSLIERGNNDERKEQRQELLKRHPIVANILYAINTDPVHPSPLQRAARFEKRIAKLEQQQQQDVTTQQE